MRVTLVRALVLLTAVALLSACRREAPVPTGFVMEPARPGNTGTDASPLFTIQLEPQPAALQELATHSIDVEDPVYRRPKRYEGFRLSEVVERLAPARASLGDDAHLVLVCRDGYRAPLTMRLARGGGNILAKRDRDAAATWEQLPSGTAVKTPAPFYLVWEPSARADGRERPWPYGVVAIEVWLADPADRAKPSRTGDGIARGYDVFKQKCINCHRVNGAGGALASELNTPANVTEYWNPLALRQFILNPASIRAESKMPRLTGLAEHEVDAVLEYLESMKYQKLVVK
ncbi:MAG TPA: cytochrome c [Gemmatimonadales bacterium]|nr:cytochrome c [Gemmatimonadales bacterium]